jgi:hypothetical protein
VRMRPAVSHFRVLDLRDRDTRPDMFAQQRPAKILSLHASGSLELRCCQMPPPLRKVYQSVLHLRSHVRLVFDKTCRARFPMMRRMGVREAVLPTLKETNV